MKRSEATYPLISLARRPPVPSTQVCAHGAALGRIGWGAPQWARERDTPRTTEIGRRRRGDPRRDARARRRGRHQRDVNGRPGRAGQGVEDDDLPAVDLEGATRARGAPVGDGAARRRRHGFVACRRARLPDRARRADVAGPRQRRAPTPHRGRVSRRIAAQPPRRLRAVPTRSDARDPRAWCAASSPPAATSTCSPTCSSGRSSTVGC